MASLYIKDEETAASVRRMAQRIGTTQTETVRRGMEALAKELPADQPPPRPPLAEWLAQRRRERPLPPATGVKADKAFFDRLWGEPE